MDSDTTDAADQPLPHRRSVLPNTANGAKWQLPPVIYDTELAGTRPRRSAAITRAAAFCQLCSDRCGTSVTNHCHACRATGSSPAAVAFCAYARTPTTYGK